MGAPISTFIRTCAGDDGEYSHSRNLKENIAIGSAILSDDNTRLPVPRRTEVKLKFELVPAKLRGVRD